MRLTWSSSPFPSGHGATGREGFHDQEPARSERGDHSRQTLTLTPDIIDIEERVVQTEDGVELRVVGHLVTREMDQFWTSSEVDLRLRESNHLG